MQIVMSAVPRRRFLSGITAAGLVLWAGLGCEGRGPGTVKPVWSAALEVDSSVLNADSRFEPDIAAGSSIGFLLVGRTFTREGKVGPGAAFSPEGKHWEMLPAEAFPTSAGKSLTDLLGIVTFQGALWVVGGQGGDGLVADSAVIWQSKNGRDFALKAVGHSMPSADDMFVAVLRNRLVLMSSDYDGRAGWWNSIDGSAWVPGEGLEPISIRTVVPTHEEILVLGTFYDGKGMSSPTVRRLTLEGVQDITDRFQNMSGVWTGASREGQTILVGQLESDSTQPAPAVWVTTDGLDWTSSTKFQLADTHFDVRVDSVCATKSGFVATGTARKYYRSVALVWYTTDGISWSILDELPSSPLAVTYREGQLLLAAAQVRGGSATKLRSETSLRLYAGG